MVKLQWLQVNKFRTVKPGTRLTFNPGHNVLLGQNGTGKTTLLNLVTAVVKSDFNEFKETEFDFGYELISPKAKAVISVRHERRSLPLTAAVDSLPQETINRALLPPDSNLQGFIFSAELAITSLMTGTALQIRIHGQQARIWSGNKEPQRPTIEYDVPPSAVHLWTTVLFGLIQWNKEPTLSPELLGLLEIFTSEQQTVRFDEALEYFSLVNRTFITFSRQADGAISQSGWPTPNIFGDHLLSAVQKKWGEAYYTLKAEQLPFLKATVEILGFESAAALIELQEANRNEKAETMKLSNLRFIFSQRGGSSMFTEKQLSHGQKRMLALLHYLAGSQSFAIVDELVNGLHHRWIRLCIEALGDRQVFLTSQNPLLLDYLAFQSPEEVRSTFVLCRWEKDSEQMAWENMTQEAAQDFFDSYKVGFQQVGELLQSKGLW